MRGNQLLRSRQLEEAVDGFQKAIAIIPISQDSVIVLGVVVGGRDVITIATCHLPPAAKKEFMEASTRLYHPSKRSPTADSQPTSPLLPP
ncbi:hypothetical protein AAEJ74_06145 [Limnospira fusiformis PMC 851.14]|uniref:Tetratricopeptide repeat protein n=1 Tax=Limnospira fusiformis PMC 851.14 TaxID=2219512 RepID=A0ABU9EJ20_LIMFS